MAAVAARRPDRGRGGPGPSVLSEFWRWLAGELHMDQVWTLMLGLGSKKMKILSSWVGVSTTRP